MLLSPIAVITVEPAVKFSFVSKGTETRVMSQHNAERPTCLVCMSILNRPFLSCVEPQYESEAACKVFVMKISFHLYVNKTNFQMKVLH